MCAINSELWVSPKAKIKEDEKKKKNVKTKWPKFFYFADFIGNFTLTVNNSKKSFELLYKEMMIF